MKHVRPDQITLYRCADAAGFAAVSSLDDDIIAPKKPIALLRMWRAALAFFFVLL